MIEDRIEITGGHELGIEGIKELKQLLVEYVKGIMITEQQYPRCKLKSVDFCILVDESITVNLYRKINGG